MFKLFFSLLCFGSNFYHQLTSILSEFDLSRECEMQGCMLFVPLKIMYFNNEILQSIDSTPSSCVALTSKPVVSIETIFADLNTLDLLEGSEDKCWQNSFS